MKTILVKDNFTKYIVYETNDPELVKTAEGKLKAKEQIQNKHEVFGDLNPKTAFSDTDITYQFQSCEIIKIDTVETFRA